MSFFSKKKANKPDSAKQDEKALPDGQANPSAQPVKAESPPPASAAPSSAHKEEEEEPLTLLGHLNEMRHRLTRVLIVIMLGFVACYGFSEAVYAFLSEPLVKTMPEGSKLMFTAPQGAFFVYLKVGLVTSLFLTSPFTFYQIWAFIAPGLYKEEKQAVMPLAFFSAFFFIAGASFCYTFVFPIAFQFFMGFATETIVPMISIEEYLSFALKLLIAFGLVFEMPLFAYFLAKLGLLTPEFMRRNRKFAILLIFVVAAILTPPDVFSQVLMAIPMLVLYEVSVYVAVAARKGRDKKTKTAQEEEERLEKARKAAEENAAKAAAQAGPEVKPEVSPNVPAPAASNLSDSSTEGKSHA